MKAKNSWHYKWYTDDFLSPRPALSEAKQEPPGIDPRRLLLLFKDGFFTRVKSEIMFYI